VRIEPRVLKGFRDYLPEQTIERQRMIHLLERVFTSFGFVPIDTPAIEYAEILLGKGSDETDKQLYRFLDNGERDVALRFDLTVPLARYVATHIEQLGTPFKRFHIAPVWRAEKPQRGRYREFIQCDFDTIGTTSVYADAEIVAVINSALNALDVKHQIRINNRLLLNGFLESLGSEAKPASVLRTIDKLEKQGRDSVERELAEESQLKTQEIQDLFEFLALSSESTTTDLLGKLEQFVSKRDNETARKGFAQLASLVSSLDAFGVPNEAFRIDLSIARGLDYYTGTVFETQCLELPAIGSICSGGRYDNLASLYTSRNLPGVGASVGLDRVIASMEELGRLSKKQTMTEVLVTVFDESSQLKSIQLADQLRRTGLVVEVYPEATKIANQLKYANKKGIDLVLFVGEREIAANAYGIKSMLSGEQVEAVRAEDLASTIRKLVKNV